MARSSGNPNIVALLPWVSTQPNAQNRLEDTEFYELLCDNGLSERGKFKAKLFQFYNDIAPFYLPLSYYTMDSIEIQKNSKNGQYWANASHYLYCMEGEGHGHFYENLVADLNDGIFPFDKLVTAHSKNLKAELVKDNEINKCGAVEDFLLNPWVLIQLPSHPGLYHQWAVALLAEVLKFQKEISDLIIVETPSSLHPALLDLKKMSISMHAYAQSHLKHYLNCCANNWKFKHSDLIKFFPVMLPELKFLLSDECKYIVKALKRLAWGVQGVRQTHEESASILAMNETTRSVDSVNIYSQAFWDEEGIANIYSDFELFGYDANMKNLHWQLICDRTMPADGNMLELMLFVEEKIMKPGRLCGASNDVVYEAVAIGHHMLFKAMADYNFYIRTSSEADICSNDEKFGLIFNIISLYADVRVKEALDLMVQIILFCHEQLCFQTSLRSEIYINAVDAEGPHISLSSIMKNLEKITTDEQMSYECLLGSVRRAAMSPNRIVFLEIEPQRVAQHFQERIRIIVLRQIEEQYKSFQTHANEDPNNLVYHPEMSTVQLLLPCFVATFLDLHSGEGVSQSTKERFQRFVHELIRSYEEVPFVLTAGSAVLCPSLNWHLMKNTASKKMEKFTVYLKQLLGDKSRYFKQINRFCLQYFQTCTVRKKLEDISNDHWLQMEYSWFSRVDTFLTRWLQSIEKIIPSADRSESASSLPVHLIWEKFAYKKESPQMQVHGIYTFLVHKLEGSVKLKQLRKIPMHIRKAAGELRMEQLAGLVTYLDLKDLRNIKRSLLDCATYPLDKCGQIYLALKASNWWKIKLLICSKRNSVDDFSLVPYHVARNNFLYRDVMRTLSPRGRVFLKSPGEVTFCPVKHCRWCGEASVNQFRVCPLCKDHPDYPDLNFFCSETCEQQCLEKQHIEEHAQYLMMLIGLVEW